MFMSVKEVVLTFSDKTNVAVLSHPLALVRIIPCVPAFVNTRVFHVKGN